MTDDICRCYDNWALVSHTTVETAQSVCALMSSRVDTPKTGAFHKYAECAVAVVSAIATQASAPVSTATRARHARDPTALTTALHAPASLSERTWPRRHMGDYTPTNISESAQDLHVPRVGQRSPEGCKRGRHLRRCVSKRMCPYGNDVLRTRAMTCSLLPGTRCRG
jgi:hypothetical protein